MAIPLLLLYEVSIKVVARVEKKKAEKLKDIA
jgi:Sec-independent protein secretion pathway component TatC